MLQRTPLCVCVLSNIKPLDCSQTQLRFFYKNVNMFRSKKPSSGHHYKNSENIVQRSTN